MPAKSGITDPSQEPARSLIEGWHIRCPHCEKLCNPQTDLRRFHRREEFAMELNVVYEHKRSREGCGHVFSPGDQRVILAWINGDLVPRAELEEAERRIKELEGQRAGMPAALMPVEDQPLVNTVNGGG